MGEPASGQFNASVDAVCILRRGNRGTYRRSAQNTASSASKLKRPLWDMGPALPAPVPVARVDEPAAELDQDSGNGNGKFAADGRIVHLTQHPTAAPCRKTATTGNSGTVKTTFLLTYPSPNSSLYLPISRVSTKRHFLGTIFHGTQDSLADATCVVSAHSKK